MKSDAEFVKDFKDSHAVVQMVAEMLLRRGYPVRVPEQILRPDVNQRFSYTDDGDIECDGKVIEVKGRSISFTSVSDYPYPTIFVNEVYKVTPERMARLMGYAIVNRQRTHVACIKRNTYWLWQKETKFDAKQDRICESYACPKELATFLRL